MVQCAAAASAPSAEARDGVRAIQLPIDTILETAPVSVDAGLEIGRSIEQRPLRGFHFGRGSFHACFIGGCHADEPVGPWMLRRLVAWLATLGDDSPWLRDVSWTVVPHCNPDGEERNRTWSDDDPGALSGAAFDLERYLRHRIRELPGDDIEFGFPRDDSDDGARPENLAVAAFLRRQVASRGALAVHGSFHGMGFAGGPWFLLDRDWIDRTGAAREALARRVATMEYALHDVQRNGEKGFDRIERGFCTRPDSDSMRRFFLDRNDAEMAARFRPSSMEFARRTSPDALTFVSEMPLFIVPGMGDSISPSDPVAQRFRGDVLPRLELAARSGSAPPPRVPLTPAPMPLLDQMTLQLVFADEALRAARDATGSRSDEES